MKRTYDVEKHKARCRANYRRRKALGLTTQAHLINKYGKAGARVYNAWIDIKKRIRNATGNNRCYRNVILHEEWDNNFLSFWAEIGDPFPGASVDRINGSLGYVPGNVRWATQTQQGRNRRGVKFNMDLARQIRISVANGEMTRMQWAKKLGVTWTPVDHIVKNKTWREDVD